MNNNKIVNNIIPVVSYLNAYTNKNDICKNNKGRSGIYRWNNLITNKSYVGSSISLDGRFSIYYSTEALKRKLNIGSSAIYSALLKYGYSNFSLDILEYCEPSLLITREQHYIDLLNPEYNLLKIAGSRLGFKHSNETKIKMSRNRIGSDKYFFGKRHTDKSRELISLSLKGIIRSNGSPKTVKLETRIKLSLRTQGVDVKVFDKLNNLVAQFPTITSAAKYFNISNRTLGRYLNKNVFYKDYRFESSFDYK